MLAFIISDWVAILSPKRPDEINANLEYSCSDFKPPKIRTIDNIEHLSGFVINTSDEVDSRTQVFISPGRERVCAL